MKNVMTFLQEVRVELAKVSWPSRQEFIGSTVIALLVILAFAIYLGTINFVFYTGAQKVLQYFVFGMR